MPAASGTKAPLLQRGPLAVAILATEPELGTPSRLKRAGRVGAGDEDGVEPPSSDGSGTPAGDGEALPTSVLVLEPGAAATTRGVGGVEALCDDALDPVRTRHGEHGLELVRQRRREAPGRAGTGQFVLEQRAAVAVYDAGGAVQGIPTIPELSLGIYPLVWGFKASPILSEERRAVLHPAVLAR
jgi:hypothetical protein